MGDQSQHVEMCTATKKKKNNNKRKNHCPVALQYNLAYGTVNHIYWQYIMIGLYCAQVMIWLVKSYRQQRREILWEQ